MRETERRARNAEATPRAKVVPHPDQKAALERAEDALERALGTGVRVRSAAKGVRAELSFESWTSCSSSRTESAAERDRAQGASRSIRQAVPVAAVAEAS